MITLLHYMAGHMKEPLAMNLMVPALQTYAMITGRHCPREGFLGIYKGQFIASSKRIRGRSKALYQEMLQLIEADRDHPLHR